MKSIKIQKSKSMQKDSTSKNIRNKKSEKQNNNINENSKKNKIKHISIKMKNNIQKNSKKAEVNISNNSFLINAIESNNPKKVEEILKKNSLNINQLNANGLSPLHISVIKGNIKIINLLIKNGAKINILSSKNKQTPLHIAYLNNSKNSENIIKLLKNNGADDNILDIFNKKPSDYQTDLKNNKNIIKTNKNTKKKTINNNIKNNDKKDKKNGYKGNIYTLKDSKDSTFIIMTMDNISYLTSDENTIFQVSDINTKNNSILNNNNINENKDKVNNSNNNNTNTKNDNILKDSLEEEDNNYNNKDNDLLETKKIKYYENNFFEKNELVDSLEISNDPFSPDTKKIDRKEKTPNEYDNKYINNYNNIISNTYVNNPSKNLDDIFKSLITNKRYSYFKLVKNNSSMKNDKTFNRNTFSSHYENTDNSTNKMINNNSIENTNKKFSSIIQYSKKNNELIYSNAYRANRNSVNSIASTISQTNKKKNYKKAQSFTKENEIKNDFAQINKDCSFLLNWLLKLNLSSYYKNFLDHDIYDITKLIQQMKSPENKFNYYDIESILVINKPGHIFRILTQLEVDAGLIDQKVANFMVYYNKDIMESSYMGNVGKKSHFFCDESFSCNNCCNLDIEICGLKSRNGNINDLKSFLTRYDLLSLYQNFLHNGFDLINYVILQMYGSYPINNDILENFFHIYDENQRNLLLKAIRKEIKKIDNFLNSEKFKYYENENSSLIKYDKVIFEKDTNNLGNTSEIRINNVKNECIII